MKKIKIFYDVIEEAPKWLNNLSEQGYRLLNVYNCIYIFEKTNIRYYYGIQYIGYNSNMYNIKYIDTLNDSGYKTFRIPLNQMNIAFGKIRLRPFAEKNAKISTSFDNYNKEFLIVESLEKNDVILLTSNNDKYLSYLQLTKTYLHGVLILLFLTCIGLYNLLLYASIYIYTLNIFVIVTLILFLLLVFRMYKKSKYYKKLASISE